MTPREIRKGDSILKLESFTPNERKHNATVYIMHDGTIRHGTVGEDHIFVHLTYIDIFATEHVTDDMI